MAKFSDLTIEKAVKEINQSYFLPDIQRQYVWLDNPGIKKIENLFDSILRGYPIGTFLFWKIKKNNLEIDKNTNNVSNTNKINFQLYEFIETYDIRRPHNRKIDPEQINADDLTIVLDGQQRLTSLYLGLKGSRTLKEKYCSWDNPNAFKEKKLYLNLKHIPNIENPDDNYQFEFHKDPKSDENHYWFKVGDILNIESLLDYITGHNLSNEEYKILEKLQREIRIEANISFFNEEEVNLDKVLKIFIRVNSGGTVLSYSDLLMSILTANFNSDIREMMNELVDDMSKRGVSIMGRDQILKTCLLLYSSDGRISYFP